MRQRFGFDLSMEAVRLMKRGDGFWYEEAVEPIEGADIVERLEALARRVPEGEPVEIFLPGDQILYADVPVTSLATAPAEIARTLDGRTPYALQELEVDWEPLSDQLVRVAAIARDTLDEAAAFAEVRGLRACRYSSLAGAQDFPRLPDFGAGPEDWAEGRGGAEPLVLAGRPEQAAVTEDASGAGPANEEGLAFEAGGGVSEDVAEADEPDDDLDFADDPDPAQPDPDVAPPRGSVSPEVAAIYGLDAGQTPSDAPVFRHHREAPAVAAGGEADGGAVADGPDPTPVRELPAAELSPAVDEDGTPLGDVAALDPAGARLDGGGKDIEPEAPRPVDGAEADPEPMPQADAGDVAGDRPDLTPVTARDPGGADAASVEDAPLGAGAAASADAEGSESDHSGEAAALAAGGSDPFDDAGDETSEADGIAGLSGDADDELAAPDGGASDAVLESSRTGYEVSIAEVSDPEPRAAEGETAEMAALDAADGEFSGKGAEFSAGQDGGAAAPADAGRDAMADEPPVEDIARSTGASDRPGDAREPAETGASEPAASKTGDPELGAAATGAVSEGDVAEPVARVEAGSADGPGPDEDAPAVHADADEPAVRDESRPVVEVDVDVPVAVVPAPAAIRPGSGPAPALPDAGQSLSPARDPSGLATWQGREPRRAAAARLLPAAAALAMTIGLGAIVWQIVPDAEGTADLAAIEAFVAPDARPDDLLSGAEARTGAPRTEDNAEDPGLSREAALVPGTPEGETVETETAGAGETGGAARPETPPRISSTAPRALARFSDPGGGALAPASLSGVARQAALGRASLPSPDIWRGPEAVPADTPAPLRRAAALRPARGVDPAAGGADLPATALLAGLPRPAAILPPTAETVSGSAAFALPGPLPQEAVGLANAGRQPSEPAADPARDLAALTPGDAVIGPGATAVEDGRTSSETGRDDDPAARNPTAATGDAEATPAGDAPAEAETGRETELAATEPGDAPFAEDAAVSEDLAALTPGDAAPETGLAAAVALDADSLTPTDLARGLPDRAPRARPADAVAAIERARFGGRTRAELAAIRPGARPASAQDVAQEALGRSSADPGVAPAAGEGEPVPDFAVAESRLPRARPDDFDRVVQTALTRAVAPAAPDTSAAVRAALASPAEPLPDAEAAANARSTARMVIPSGVSVARRATIENVFDMGSLNLVGVYGTSGDRRALLRLANGNYVKVKAGDRVEGGTVAAIGEASVIYRKGGRNVALRMPGG